MQRNKEDDKQTSIPPIHIALVFALLFKHQYNPPTHAFLYTLSYTSNVS